MYVIAYTVYDRVHERIVRESKDGMSEEDAQVSQPILTLRDVYSRQGLHSIELAKRAGLSRMTIWKMNHKEGNVWFSSVQAVCKVLGISLDTYAALEPCPHADEYRPRREKP